MESFVIVILLVIGLLIAIISVSFVMFLQHKSIDAINKRLLFFTQNAIDARVETFQEYIDYILQHSQAVEQAVEIASSAFGEKKHASEEQDEEDETPFNAFDHNIE